MSGSRAIQFSYDYRTSGKVFGLLYWPFLSTLSVVTRRLVLERTEADHQRRCPIFDHYCLKTRLTTRILLQNKSASFEVVDKSWFRIDFYFLRSGTTGLISWRTTDLELRRIWMKKEVMICPCQSCSLIARLKIVIFYSDIKKARKRWEESCLAIHLG